MRPARYNQTAFVRQQLTIQHNAQRAARRTAHTAQRARRHLSETTDHKDRASELLRSMISHFMTENASEDGLAGLTINVRGELDGFERDEVQLVMDEVSSEWRPIDHVHSVDIWNLMAEFGLDPDGQHPADGEVVDQLDDVAACTLVARQLSLLKEASTLACPICQIDYAVGEGIMVLPCGTSQDVPWGHMAHARCLKNWLRFGDSCPLCRECLPRRGDDSRADRLAVAAKQLSRFREDSRVGPPIDLGLRASARHGHVAPSPPPSASEVAAPAGSVRIQQEKRDEERRWRQMLGKSNRRRAVTARAGSPARSGR